METLEKVFEEIERYRKLNKLTTQDMANVVDISRARYCRIRKKPDSMTALEMLRYLSAIGYGVSIARTDVIKF